MEPQSNQNDAVNLPGSPGSASTMPLPQIATTSAQQSPAAPAMSSAGGLAWQQNPPVPAQAPPMPAVSPVQYPVTQVDSVAPDLSTTAQAIDTPPEAADTDVIEYAWVNRAKQVISETRSDPYKQVREINKVKADYMKKRYNKDIKLPDA